MSALTIALGAAFCFEFPHTDPAATLPRLLPSTREILYFAVAENNSPRIYL